MITIFLCDDSRDTIVSYKQQLEQIAQKHGVQISISAFESGESLLLRLSDSYNLPDIIYLDVLMGEKNGIEVAKILREHDCRAEIIFLTTSEDYVFDAFDISPVQYLIKDITTFEKFEQIFLRALSLIESKENEMFVCESNNHSKLIPFKDISYFEISKRVVTIHYQNEQVFGFYCSMEQLEKQLAAKNFVRTHRSFLVNMQYISGFRTSSVVLKTGVEIPIGVTYAEHVKEVFSEYITRFSMF